MIFLFVGEDDFYIKSDKNTREVTMLFNAFEKIRENRYMSIHRVNDTEYGTYHHVHKPYGESDKWLEEQLDYQFTYIDKAEFFNKCKELNVLVEPTNELVIRDAVKKYLDDKYNIEYIQDEYTHSSLSVRADLFAVTKDKKVITIEIKSDRDTFTRLRKQLEEYTKFSHVVYLAIDIKHLAKFLKNYPNYYGGILTYEDGQLDIYKACYQGKKIDATGILWKQELLQFTTYFNGSFTKYNIDDLETIIKNVFTVNEWYSISEYLFVNRYLKEPLDFKDLIYDLKYKNKLVEIIKKEKL